MKGGVRTKCDKELYRLTFKVHVVAVSYSNYFLATCKVETEVEVKPYDRLQVPDDSQQALCTSCLAKIRCGRLFLQWLHVELDWYVLSQIHNKCCDVS